MEALISEPANREEDKEDYALAQSMLAADDTKRVSEQSIISKLTK